MISFCSLVETMKSTFKIVIFSLQSGPLPGGGDPIYGQVPEPFSTHSRTPISGRVGRVSGQDVGQPDPEGPDVWGEEAPPDGRPPAGSATVTRQSWRRTGTNFERQI